MAKRSMGKGKTPQSRKVTNLDHQEEVGLMYIMKASTGLSFDIPLASFGGKWTNAPDKA